MRTFPLPVPLDKCKATLNDFFLITILASTHKTKRVMISSEMSLLVEHHQNLPLGKSSPSQSNSNFLIAILTSTQKEMVTQMQDFNLNCLPDAHTLHVFTSIYFICQKLSTKEKEYRGRSCFIPTACLQSDGNTVR